MYEGNPFNVPRDPHDPYHVPYKDLANHLPDPASEKRLEANANVGSGLGAILFFALLLFALLAMMGG
ncbi:MAG: hypothetical protein L0Z53_27220 [Acidobacteriales bacterium]|nr:hypothetical protein [Terriglobales bacterium]